ncbi:hypothetical protein F0562_034709 [Nyssa sinensis]|uniref:Uncharacterized protein n=1 Tax=Nyssa sinensis TaxID=561372 RepID=A0A5J5ACV0_9ASTE|nr:hypothetical protein F0562_034709 [Nyssa sinensis]
MPKGCRLTTEGVFVARGKTMSVCIAANAYTDSDPFISALEFVLLGDSLYNSTDFGTYGIELGCKAQFWVQWTDHSIS